jgi:hypothetical protein
LIIIHSRIVFCREKKREREREELWKRLHELADEIQKGDKHGTIGTQALPSSTQGDAASNQLNSTATNNQNNQASSAQSHSASSINTQMNSLSISAAGSMSK